MEIAKYLLKFWENLVLIKYLLPYGVDPLFENKIYTKLTELISAWLNENNISENECDVYITPIIEEHNLECILLYKLNMSQLYSIACMSFRVKANSEEIEVVSEFKHKYNISNLTYRAWLCNQTYLHLNINEG